MGKKDVEREVEERLRPVVQEMGVSLVDLRYVKEGPEWLLRLIIFKPGGVGLEDCEAVSNRVSAVLDADDPVPNRYLLEVSSPGLERVFRRDEEYSIFAGRKVCVSTYAPVEGFGREIRGTLLGLDAAVGPRGDPPQMVVRIETGNGVAVIPRSNVAKARLDELGLPSQGQGRRRRR